MKRPNGIFISTYIFNIEMIRINNWIFECLMNYQIPINSSFDIFYIKSRKYICQLCTIKIYTNAIFSICRSYSIDAKLFTAFMHYTYIPNFNVIACVFDSPFLNVNLLVIEKYCCRMNQ